MKWNHQNIIAYALEPNTFPPFIILNKAVRITELLLGYYILIHTYIR